MKTRDVYNEYRSYSSSIGFHNVCALPVFGKVIKKYENKYNFSIFKPHNVSSIKFDWEKKQVKTDIDKQRKRAEYIKKKYELLNKDNGTE